MIKKSVILFFVFINLTAFGQWKSHYPEKKQNKKTTLSKEKKQDNNIYFNNLFFNAIKQKSLENYELAVGLFQKCIDINSNKIEPHHQISLIKKSLNKFSEAKQYSSKTIELKTNNIWHLRNHAEILFLNQEFDKAAKQYSDIVKREPKNEFNYYKLADTYIYSQRYLKAISVYEDLEKKKGIDKMISMQKHKLYLQLKDFNNATKCLETLSNNFPNDLEVLQILAEAYLLTNEKDKAIIVFQSISEKDPKNGQIHLTLANFHRDNGDLEKSFLELKLAFRSEKIAAETKLAILSSYLSIINANDTIKKQAFELADILKESDVSNSATYAVLGDLYYASGNKILAKENYKKSLSIDQNLQAVWTQVLFLEVEEANYDSLLYYSENALSYFPSEPLYYYFYGVSCSFFKQFDKSKEALESGIGFVFDNPSLYSEFQSSLADTYHSLELFSKSDSLYEQILLQNPNNIIVLNNYSYYLSLRKYNLERAKEMSKRCNDLEPDNGTYQDTYAWILYCLEDYKSALEWIKKALKNGSDKSPVVVEHYGDILFRLGFTQEALEKWLLAKSLGSESIILENKISNEKLLE